MARKNKSRKIKNKYMKEYFDTHPLINALHCHNLERRKRNYHNIDMEEYLKYRKHFGVNSLGKIKTKGRISNIVVWEKLKVTNV